MAKESVAIIDETCVMLVGIPKMSDFLAFDVIPFKLKIPVGWFDSTHRWLSHKYNITVYIYNGLDHDVGINKPAMQILKWLCNNPNKPTDVYGVAVLFNQDDSGNYVDFTVDEFVYILAEVKHLERTNQSGECSPCYCQASWSR